MFLLFNPIESGKSYFYNYNSNLNNDTNILSIQIEVLDQNRPIRKIDQYLYIYIY